MRQLQLEVLDQDSIRELASGHRLKLVFGEKMVAEIIPTDLKALADQQEVHERERMEARARLLEIMDRGYDLGGYKITNRDELYDRD